MNNAIFNDMQFKISCGGYLVNKIPKVVPTLLQTIKN